MKTDFLADPNNIFYEIRCFECRRGIWRTQILKHDGRRPVSTETHGCDPEVPKFSAKLSDCPFCKKKFYAMGKSGVQMYLIKDMRSGITRLI